MRCVKRGIGDNCTEGHRKKAKYLLDEEELGESQSCDYPSDRLSSRPTRGAQAYEGAQQLGAPAVGHPPDTDFDQRSVVR
jgi:hypothetical protein